MTKHEQIQAINRVIKEYFDLHPREKKVPAKDLMPFFIKAGIVPKEQKGGLPIRSLLRELDRSKQLSLIPSVHSERKLQITNWFFVRIHNNLSIPTPQKVPLTAAKRQPKETTKTAGSKSRDEDYVLDVCDQILNQKSLRQHRFDFLKGDTGRKLPVDAFYPKLKLVIEYRERQHTEAVKHFDKPHIMTVSGVDRGKQRTLYDERRRTVLAAQKIKLVEIPYNLFSCNSSKRIVHSPNDPEILKAFLRTWI